jgi:rubrerythrin
MRLGKSMNKSTIARLIELAIAAEKAAEELYRGLEAKFAHYEDVADFWGEYAGEEVMHATWLEQLRDSLAPKRLSAPADPDVMEDARRALQIPVKRRLQDVHDLEDAYQLAHELENSETNAVFGFLISNFAEDKKTQAFLRSQLQDHVGKLAFNFPVQPGVVRVQIKAKD